MSYWRLRLGEGGAFVSHGRRGNFIGISWGELGDLSELRSLVDGAYDRLREKYVRDHPQDNNYQIGKAVGTISRFLLEIRNEDLIVVPDTERDIILIARITSDYQYVPEPQDGCPYKHRRSVEWLKDIPRTKLSEHIKNSIGSLQTLVDLNEHRDEIETLVTDVKVPRKSRPVSGEELVEELIKKLLSLEPKRFQSLVAEVLGALGFEEAMSNPMQGDRDIDVVGTLKAEGVTQIDLRVQVKRWSNNIGIEEVQRLRGALETARSQQGAIITTSDFTQAAKLEAEAPNKTPISLIDGRDFTILILKAFDKLDKATIESLLIRRIPERSLPDQFVIEKQES